MATRGREKGAGRKALEAHFLAHLRRIKADIRQHLGPDPPDLARYYRDYKKVFSRAQESVRTRGQMLDHAARSRVVLLGDFHTLNRAQGEALKLARELWSRSGEKLVLALECFRSSSQPVVDKFLAGKITERQLLDEGHYSSRWGFPWPGYRDLMYWAKEHGVPVLAMDSTGRLHTRDVRMANRLEDSMRHRGDCLHLALVGDLHLAPGHLPRELARRFGLRNTNRFLTVIYQNSESVYLRAMEQGGQPESVYHLASNRFLVINTAPWTKMATFLTWLEKESHSWLAAQDEEPRILDDRLQNLEKQVEAYLEVDLLDRPLHLATEEEAARLLAKPNTRQMKLLRAMYHNGHPVILKKKRVLALPRLTFHHMVEGIFQNILQHYLPNPVLERPSGRTFCRMVQFFMASFTVSQLVTPGRQTPNLAQLRSRLRKLTHGPGSRSEESRTRAEAVRLAIEILEALRKDCECAAGKLRDFVRRDRKLAHEAVMLVAYHLGDRLFRAHQRGTVPREDLRYLLLFGSSEPLRLFHRILTGLRKSRLPWPGHQREIEDGDCRRPGSW